MGGARTSKPTREAVDAFTVRRAGWLALAIGWAVAVVAVDVAQGRDQGLTGLLAMVPLLAAFGASPRLTAAVGAASTVLAATNLFGLNRSTTEVWMLRTAGVVVGSVIAVTAAVERDRRERRDVDRRDREAAAERARVDADAAARRNATAAALAHAHEPAAVLEAIAARAIPEVGQQVVALWLVDDTGGTIEFAGGYGFEPSVTGSVGPIPLDSDLPAAVAIRSGEPVVYGSREERDRRWPALAHVASDRATAVMPLDAGAAPFGCLSFGFAPGTEISPALVSVLGAISAECALALDRARLFVSERRTRETLEFLAEVTHTLVSTADVGSVVRRLTDLAVPRLADWCAVYLAEPGGLRRVAASLAGGDGALLAPLANQEVTCGYEARSPVAEAWRTGEMQSVEGDGPLDHDVIDAPRSVGLTATHALPIRADGRVIGVLSTGYADGRRRDPNERFALTGLALRAGIALANARRFDAERRMVEALTNALLPGSVPTLPGYGLATRYVPATGRVSGDWYEAALLDDGDLLLGVGDAAGHGIAASSTMAALRNAATSQAITGATPAQILDVLGRLARLSGEAPYATALYLRLDPGSGRLRIASAGHPPPLHVPALGGVHPLAVPPGVPLGVRAERPYVDTEATLEPGGTVVVVTDGVIERRGEAITTGIERLADFLASNRSCSVDGLGDRIVEDLCADREDDCCVVVLHRDA